MRDQEAIKMMERCAEEIASLRRHIEQLAPKAEAFDAITQILGLMPRRSVSGGEDLVWTLRRRIEELKRAAVEATAGEPA